MPIKPDLTLWGRTSSANVQKVLWTLEELGVPYTHHQVGGQYGGLDTPSFSPSTPTASCLSCRMAR